MTEVFDMNINDLLGEDSEFIGRLRAILENLGVDIDADSLSVILQEYEMIKIEFLKSHIINLLKARGTNLNDFEDGPLKVVVSNTGVDFEAIDEDDEQIDSDIVS